MKALSVDTNTAIPLGLVSEGHIENDEPLWVIEMAKSLGTTKDSDLNQKDTSPSITQSSRHFIIPDVDASIHHVETEEMDELIFNFRL